MKPHPEYVNYGVTESGQVWSFHRNKYIKLVVLRGYQKAPVRKSGKTKLRMVHRMVWEAFVGPIPDGMEINHKNRNRVDNRLSNLEVVSSYENLAHAGFAPRPVVLTNMRTGEKLRFNSVRSAAIKMGLKPGGLWRALEGKRRSTFGWRAEYAREPVEVDDGSK